MKAAIRNTKKKESHKFQSSKKNFQGTQHPLIRVGRRKKRGVMMKAANKKHKIKETQVSIINDKHSRYTPPTNQVWEEKEEVSNDDSSYPKYR